MEWMQSTRKFLITATVFIIWCSVTLAQLCPQKCTCDGPVVLCPNSQMKYVPLGIPIDTTYLDFCQNNLQIIKNQTQLHNLPKLETLILKENNITTIEAGSFWGHGALKHLDLSFNDLRVLNKTSFSGLKGVNTLLLHDNPKLCLDFGSLGNLPDLIKLVLGKTAARVIPGLFEFTPGIIKAPIGLLELQLWDMDLLQVPYDALKELPNLLKLDLSQNQIKCLPNFVFVNNVNLTYLDLSSNPIVIIHSDAFQGLGRLANLLLDNTNSLTAIPEHVFEPLPGSVQVCLYGNRWNCDCHLKWLKLWMKEERRVHCAQKPNCYSPSNLRGNPFYSTPDELFRCDNSISKLPQVECHLNAHERFSEGYCLKLFASASMPLATTPPATTAVVMVTKSNISSSSSNHSDIIITVICMLVVLGLILGVFIARQVRIQKKLHDQNKYFNISYENGDQQLQMAESPTMKKRNNII